MALTETRPETAGTPASGPDRPAPGPLERLIGSGDHFALGRLFIGFSLLFGAAALLTIAVVGVDTATDNGFLGGRAGMLGSSSLVALLVLAAMPLLLGVAVSVVPMQVGSPAIAFPRAVALSLWTWVISAAIYITSVAIDGGVGGADTDAARLGNIALGAMMVAIGLGSVCVATTVVAHRPPGMGLARVPFLSWSFLLGGSVWILTLAGGVAHVLVNQVAHYDASRLAVEFTTGMAWLLRGPSIYAVAIPALGIGLDVVSHVTGRRVVQYGLVQGLIGAYAVLSFGVWAQLPRSINTAVWTFFALAIAVPVLGLLGALGDLLRRGTAKVTPAAVLSLLTGLLLLGSVLAGLVQALDLAGVGTIWSFNATALGAAQTYFVISAALAGGIAGVFHWAPLVWGGQVPKGPGNGAVAAVFLGGALLATASLVQGIVQMDGETTASQVWGAAEAAGALLVALGALSAFAALAGAARAGADGPGEAEEGLTLEWAFPSPAVGGSVPEGLPEVVTSPYPLLDAREGTDEEKS